MGIKICPNCSEKLINLTQKCPKCGTIPEKSTSPVLIGVAIVVVLVLVVIAGLVFL
ncbi:MAG: hypothetical protein HN888_10170 [Desulfobacula sp.]|jgi:hypothetical protein|nr:hypothetical protein [Desulfobacula sp.]